MRTLPSVAFVLVAALVSFGTPTRSDAAGQIVAFPGYAAGTIVVRTSERKLYLVLDRGQALRYPVGVGRDGLAMGRHFLHRCEVHRPKLGAASRSQT